MDGFDMTLKEGLRKASGEILFYSRDGFFRLDEKISTILSDLGVETYDSILQTEGFLIHDRVSKGVVVKGVSPKQYGRLTNLQMAIGDKEIVIGKEMAAQLRLEVGNTVVVTFASGKKGFSKLPFLQRLTVSGIVSHGIYDKDLRFAYMNRSFLQNILGYEGKVNIVSLNVPEQFKVETNTGMDDILNFSGLINDKLDQLNDSAYIVKPYWMEFGGLIEAVKIEKFSITLILQLVVIIAIFNIAAFFIFINEKKAQEIFLFRTLGIRKKDLVYFWTVVIGGLWGISCFGAVILSMLFNWCLSSLDIFKIPSDIYVLDSLQIYLELSDYLYVFSAALLWMCVIAGINVWRTMRYSVLKGLRREFS